MGFPPETTPDFMPKPKRTVKARSAAKGRKYYAVKRVLEFVRDGNRENILLCADSHSCWTYPVLALPADAESVAALEKQLLDALNLAALKPRVWGWKWRVATVRSMLKSIGLTPASGRKVKR